MLDQDIRFALRQLLRSQGFMPTAVPTLALGLGVGEAVIRMIHSLPLQEVE